MKNYQHINQDSGEVEYYTDTRIVEASRRVMGNIDLDPASCTYANNNHVKTTRFYNKKHDGLSLPWVGNIWMNHPFSKGENPCPVNRAKCKKKICNDPKYKNYRGHHIDKRIPGNSDWIDKLISEYLFGRLKQSCNITFGATSEIWFQRLAVFPQCLLSPRTNYYQADGSLVKGITKGSVVTYIGSNVERFNDEFSSFGRVLVPFNYSFKEIA